MAFGDGSNDLPLFSAVETGVAMGNAADALKNAATFVTDTAYDDGIYKGLRQLGLI